MMVYFLFLFLSLLFLLLLHTTVPRGLMNKLICNVFLNYLKFIIYNSTTTFFFEEETNNNYYLLPN